VDLIPRLKCRGPIEAINCSAGYYKPTEGFHGSNAVAPLKQHVPSLVARVRIRIPRLKCRGPIEALGTSALGIGIRLRFHGSNAVAPLKPEKMSALIQRPSS